VVESYANAHLDLSRGFGLRGKRPNANSGARVELYRLDVGGSASIYRMIDMKA
jgi:hypothetical protein